MNVNEPISAREAWKELEPLRKVVAAQFAKPVMPTEQGFSDLVDRVTVAVAAYMGREVPSTPAEARRLADAMEQSSGTVDGIRPHRPVTEQQDRRMKSAAEQWERDNPVTPERAAAMMAGRRNPTSCMGCGQPWINAEIRHLPHCSTLRPVQQCPVQDRAHDPHGWPDDAPVWQCPGVLVPGGCPGCGAVPTEGRHGRATLHPAMCTRTSHRVPLSSAGG